MAKEKQNRFQKLYEWLFVISPWVVLAGMLQFHFQQFLPLQRLFKGVYTFDYVSVTDFFVILVFFLFLVGISKKWIEWNKNEVSWQLKSVVVLLVAAGIVQVIFQKFYHPILSTDTEYFRSLFLFPLIFVMLAYKSVNQKVINQMVKSYVLMAAFFCVIALVQYFTGVFPGEQHDFMSRLVWPYVDFITLESASANWVAFLITPALVLSFIHVFQRKCLSVYLPSLVLLLATVYLTQSYGAYIATFVAVLFYLFRALNWQKFIVALILAALVGGGVYLHQTTTWKYQVNYGDAEYRYSNSVASRSDIYKMNSTMVLTHPILGVGMNQYQSYFAATHKEILGHDYGEVHIPPHAHNFFVSFWLSLGILGFLAMVILLIDILWIHQLNYRYPATFAFIGIMTHGLIDSYYWKQEIAYIFWMVVIFAYLYKLEYKN